jgi:hypothetical protein
MLDIIGGIGVLAVMGSILYVLGRFLYLMLNEFFDKDNTASNVRASAIILFIFFIIVLLSFLS